MGTRDFNPAEPRGPHGEWTGFGAHHQKLTRLVGKSFESRYPTSGAKAASEVEATGHATVSGHGPLAERRAEQARALLESKGIHAKTEKIHRFGGKEIRIYDPKRQPSTTTLLEDVGADLHKGDLTLQRGAQPTEEHRMTVTATESVTGTRVAQGGGVRFVENPDGVREVEARICPYGVGPDSYGTTWKPGWSSDGLRESAERGQPIPMVFGHDERNLANIVGSVAAADDRPDGLYVRMRMANFDEVPSARVAYSLLRDGHISGWSFKYAGGATVPDPQHRGALQFTRARLVHVSPVIDPSIPGTATTGVRSEESQQQQEEEMDAAEIRAAIAAGIEEGLRAAGITPEPAPTPETLALSIAGALTAACGMFDARSSDLPDGMTELGALLTAASVASDELCDALGVDTSEMRSAAEQALTAAAGERATQYADPGYQKDKQQRYPIDTAEHVRAAWAYIHQEKNRAFYTAEQLTEIEGRIKTAAKRVGVEISDDTSRSADEPQVDADLAAELEAAKAKLARL